MAEVKDKIVTAESLSALHTHGKNTYMTKSNPTGVGTFTMNGDGNFSGVLEVNSLKLGDATLEYDKTDGILKISFSIDETSETETTE